MAKVSINTDIIPIPKRITVTYDQIKQFEINKDAEEELKNIMRRGSLALFETFEKKFYIYNLWDNNIYYITEDYYNHLKVIGCWSNLCPNEDYVLQMINNAINNSEWHAIAGTIREENK